MTFYHGSASELKPGDLLLPGDEVGISYYNRSEHVYMTHTNFSMGEVEYLPDSLAEYVNSAEQYALYSAFLWACWAADIACDGECGWAMDHSEAIAAAMLPDCVKVYQVEPLGPVSADSAHDVEADACRTTQAKVVKVLTDRDIAMILGW